jgi:hypothetical protein
MTAGSSSIPALMTWNKGRDYGSYVTQHVYQKYTSYVTLQGYAEYTMKKHYSSRF